MKKHNQVMDPFDFYDVDFEPTENPDIMRAVLVSKKNRAQRWYVNDILSEMSLKQQAALWVNLKLYMLEHATDTEYIDISKNDKEDAE